MRPLNMCMSAFGPYAGRQEIDFGALGKDLFLITGETGAGKTVILDGIMYALYGKASGIERTGDMLRSKYAEEGTETRVELRFENRGRIYRVSRAPKQMRKRGSTEKPAEAELVLPDGEVVTRVKAVDEKIVEILGLDADQFRQIVLIAQGDFRRVLTENTEVRVKIFRKLFRTEKYNELESLIGEAYGEANRKYQEAGRLLAAEAEAIRIPHVEDETEGKKDQQDEGGTEGQSGKRLEELSEEEILALLEDCISSDEKTGDALREEKESLAERKSLLDRQFGKAEEFRKAQEDLQKAETRLAQTEKMLKEAREQADDCKRRDTERQALLEKAAVIQREHEKYEVLAESERKRSEDAETQQKKIILQNKLKKAVETEGATVAALEKEEQELREAPAQLAELEKKVQGLTVREHRWNALETARSEYETAREDYVGAREHYLTVSRKAEDLQCRYQSANKAFLDGQAGVLAEELVPGQACPVCGATEHPAPAVRQEAVPTEQALRKARAAWETAAKEAEDGSRQAASRKGTMEALKKSLMEHVEEMLPGSTREGHPEDAGEATLPAELASIIHEKQDALTTELAQCRKDMEVAETQVKRLKEIRKELPNRKNALEDLKEQEGAACNTLAALTAALEQQGRQIEETRKALSYGSKQEAEAAEQDFREQAEEIRKAEEQADQKVRKYQTEWDGAKGAIDTLEVQVKRGCEYDLEEIGAAREKASRELATLEARIGLVQARLTGNRDLEQRVRRDVKQKEEAEKQYRMLSALHNTASGQIKDKDKIRLEVYIQQTYFDRVIRRANRRLYAMTRGQYELARRQVAATRRSQAGLDLDVIDHYNGSRRDAASLSGGESFMASLALALGLSDEVQCTAGGVALDAMFIDEGFGTLDKDILEEAIRVLADLTEGDRMVGVISHVEELQQRIDQKLVVTKDGSRGSQVRIEV